MVSHSGRMPDPGQVGGLAEFIDLLGELRAWAGQPSYRALAKQVGAMMRPPQTVSASTVVDAFKTGRSRLDMDLVMAIVRALGVTGEADLARWREAYVRAHIPPKAVAAPGTLRQLPADLATFTGRAEALAGLVKAAVSGADRVVIASIEGMGGVGKTQLAVHAGHELARAGVFADAQLYVNLRGFDPERPPADPADVLDVFLRALHVPTEQIPADTGRRAAMFRERLHGRRALLLLDNAVDEDQVRPLIPAVPGCLVLITSRRSMAGLDGCIPLELKAFPVSEAVELLAPSPAGTGSAPSRRPPSGWPICAVGCPWPSRWPPAASAPGPGGRYGIWPTAWPPAGSTPSRPAAVRYGRSSTFPTVRCPIRRGTCSVCWACIPVTTSPSRRPPRWAAWTGTPRPNCSACSRTSIW